MDNGIAKGINDMKNSDMGLVDKKYLENAIKFVLHKIDGNLEQFTYKFPFTASENLIYYPVNNNYWGSSYWTGMLWLAYEYTGDRKYREIAELQLESYRERIEKQIDIDTHDLGVLYSLSCVAAYKITGDKAAKDAALKAACELAARFKENGEFILAWGDVNNPYDQRGNCFTISSLINLPLLFWASAVTGDKKYRNIAQRQLTKVRDYLIKEDGSTIQSYFMDYLTGAPLYGKNNQGFSEAGCWARGHAQGIYGLALSYTYTGDVELLELAKQMTDYFLSRLPEDGVPYWDLMYSSADEERDSSAAVIAICGMLELAKHLPVTDKNKSIYEFTALKLLRTLIDNYTTREYSDCNGVLMGGVIHKPNSFGVDECTIIGDYHYLEALVRASSLWRLYW